MDEHVPLTETGNTPEWDEMVRKASENDRAYLVPGNFVPRAYRPTMNEAETDGMPGVVTDGTVALQSSDAVVSESVKANLPSALQARIDRMRNL